MNTLTGLPQLRVEVDSKTLGGAGTSLREIRIQQRLFLPALCEMSFIDSSAKIAEEHDFAIGSSLKVSIRGAHPPLFSGMVTAIEYGFGPSREKILNVRGYDKLYALRKQQHLRSYVRVSFKDLLDQLTAQSGLTIETSLTGPTWQWLIQDGQTDLDFLTALAYRSGLYFAVSDDILHCFSYGGRGEPTTLDYGRSLFEARTEINDAPLFSSVVCHGWSSSDAKEHSGKATAPVSGRDLPLEKSGCFPNSYEKIVAGKSSLDDSEASDLAQAILDRSHNSAITFSGVAEGNPRLEPGTPVRITGLPPSHCGSFVLTQVNHSIDQKQGFLSEISTITPAIPTPPATTGALLAIVKDIRDPDNLGRIKATIPGLDNVETDWMQVLFPAAGQNKGIVALPDVGDRVIVLPVNGDASRSIVIGNLFGIAHPFEDWGMEEGAVKRFTFLTPAGNKIQLDDHAKKIRLENSTGNYCELNSNRVVLHGEADILLEAPGKNIVIKGNKIDFQQG
jgi:uncharacterized protein involved in type VI secretion and phage assembly